MTQRWGILLSKFRSASRGQDLIEYALMVGFLAVAAGAVLPGAASSIGALFSQVGSAMTSSADSSGSDTLRQPQAIQIPCGAGGEADGNSPARTCDDVGSR